MENNCNANIIFVGDTIMVAVAEAGIDTTGVSSTTSQHATLSSTENICQTSDMLLMGNIYVYIATQE